MRIRKLAIIALGVLLCGFSWPTKLFPSQQPNATPTAKVKEDVDSVIAVVNDDVITVSEVATSVAAAKKRLQSSTGPKPTDEQLTSAVLHHMIDLRLQLQLAKKWQITKTEQDVDNAILHIAERNNLTEAQLKSSIHKQGRTFRDFRQELKDQLVLNDVQQRALGPNLRITDSQVKQFMQTFDSETKQFLLRDVLVRLPNDDPTSAQKKQALAKAKQLSSLMLKDKTLPASADVGVQDMEWRRQDELPDLFLLAIKGLQPGQVSAPILAPNGYHVVKIVDRRSQPLTQAQAQQMLMQKRFAQAYPEWIKKLRKDAYIRIMGSEHNASASTSAT